MQRKKLLIGVGCVLILLIALFLYLVVWPNIGVKEVNETMPDVVEAESIRGPFNVVPTTGHPASGSLKVIESEGETILRYENYETINGPDLRLYLSKDLKATEFVDLGDLKGTKGNINYEVPEDVDLEEYPYILTWCRAFGVLFNSVKIE